MNTAELQDYKEFVVKETEGFRLRVRKWKCVSPSDLNSVEFIQESLKDGKVLFDSTYNFFMTDSEINTLCTSLNQ
jgi:hypothetical protein